MGKRKSGSKNTAFLLIVLIFLSAIPTVSAEASITLSAMPTSQEADPGTTAEYTIVVRNTGENDVTVQLTSEQQCNGYTSTVEQPQGAISPGDSVDVILSVNLSAQPDESCDTTVRGVANEVGALPGGAPSEPVEVVVTTTAGEGSGGSTWAVQISTQHPEDKIWNENDDEVIWPITVENTGQLNSTIDLSWENPGTSGCSGPQVSWDIIIDPDQVTLDSGDEEVVIFRISGLSDSGWARLTCYRIEARITNAGFGADEDNITDELDLTLEIPEVKLCAFTTDSTSVNVAPFASQTARFTITNEGNTDFNVVITTAGNKNSWIQDIEPPNGELSHAGSMTFDVLISPDDSASAGTIHSITIRVNEQDRGAPGDIICTSTLEVTIGKFTDGSIEFVGNVPKIEPGNTDSARISITNKGNGPGNFKLLFTAEEPSGWSSSFYNGGIMGIEENNIQLEEDENIIVFLNISVPIDALADDSVVYNVKLLDYNTPSVSFDEDSTAISAAERHDIDLDSTVSSQSGKDGATVSYPFTIINPGNVADNFKMVVSKNSCTSSDGENSDWDVRFYEDVPNSLEITTINIPAKTSKNLLAKVTIDGGEKSQCRSTIQVMNTADQINLQESFNITTTSSNLIFRMNAFFENPGENPNQVESTQPPGGSVEFIFWIQNDGVFYGNPQEDNAVINVRSFNGVNYELNINKSGVMYDGSESIPIPMKYVLRDISTGEFYKTNGKVLEFTDMDEANNTWLTGGLSGTHEIMLYALQVKIKLDIDEDIEDGAGGTVYVDVRSEFNTEDIKTLEMVLKIETIHDLKIDAVNGDIQNIELPENANFELRIYNDGNTEEIIVVHISEGLRGWIPIVPDTDDLEFSLEPGEFKVIKIKVESPESSLSDEFDFTVSIQPKDANGMVGRENIELKVIAEEPSGFLPSFSFLMTISCLVLAVTANLVFKSKKMNNIS